MFQLVSRVLFFHSKIIYWNIITCICRPSMAWLKRGGQRGQMGGTDKSAASWITNCMAWYLRIRYHQFDWHHLTVTFWFCFYHEAVVHFWTFPSEHCYFIVNAKIPYPTLETGQPGRHSDMSPLTKGPSRCYKFGLSHWGALESRRFKFFLWEDYVINPSSENRIMNRMDRCECETRWEFRRFNAFLVILNICFSSTYLILFIRYALVDCRQEAVQLGLPVSPEGLGGSFFWGHFPRLDKAEVKKTCPKRRNQ